MLSFFLSPSTSRPFSSSSTPPPLPSCYLLQLRKNGNEGDGKKIDPVNVRRANSTLYCNR